MTHTARPFDDFRNLISAMPSPDLSAREELKKALDAIPGPKSILGRCESSMLWLAGWQGTDKPRIARPLVAVFAGSHGVSTAITGRDIVEAAQARVKALTEGQSSVRGMAASQNAAFKVYEMGLEYPVPNMMEEATLTEKECAASMAFGMEVVAEGADIIVLGNAGYGSSVGAAAIAKGLYGGASDYWAGGDSQTAKKRINAVEQATAKHKQINEDPLTCLRCFGGRDIAGMVGAIIAARHQSIPVILDGFVVCTAAAVLHAVDPHATSHCIAGHLSSEPAHGALLDRLGLSPLHDLGISVGDGTGAAYALGTLRLSSEALASLRGSS